MSKKQRLELTWIGKEQYSKLEPRILIEDPKNSYGDINTENILVQGDNLLALKALEQDYAGKVKCIFIDPPYNTGSAFTHYDDGIEHSLWLSLMRDRLVILRRLLSEDGSLWVTLDDNEAHYFKVMADEVFGRACFIADIAWRSSDASNNDAKTFSLDHNHILVYSKKPGWLSNPLERTEEANAHYRNPDNDPNGPWFAGNLSSPKPRPNLRFTVTSPTGIEIQPPSNGWRWKKETMQQMIDSGEIVFSEDGTRVIKKTYLKDQSGLSPSTMWDDIDDTGHNRQAKYELKKLFPEVATSELFATPKPEKLIRKILNISTVKGDLVLDSFAGSGTTGAVAHKMGRRWIMVELGEHCTSHIVPRMKKVIDGSDQGGVSQAESWLGGGGLRYYYLAPSLLKEDQYGNWIIDETYNPNMLAAAMAKHEGFRYLPDESVYWKQGQSTEKDFIFTTTNFVTVEFLDKVHEEMQPGESLLICCKSFRKECEERYPNITVKKIPKMLLGRCEFGRDDYSLNVINVPTENDNDFLEEEELVITGKAKKNGRKSDDQKQLSLMGEEA